MTLQTGGSFKRTCVFESREAAEHLCKAKGIPLDVIRESINWTEDSDKDPVCYEILG